MFSEIYGIDEEYQVSALNIWYFFGIDGSYLVQQ